MPNDLDPSLAEALAYRRHTYNRMVAEAKIRSRNLADSDIFGFVTQCLDPLARKLNHPANLNSLLDTYFPLGVRALEQRLIGSGRRAQWLLTLWTQVFPVIAEQLVRSPGLVVDLSNAAIHVARFGEKTVAHWIDDLKARGPACASAPELRSLGQVLAWRNGLAHFRDGALGEANRLPSPLASAALGGQADSWAETSAQLQNNRWYKPGATTIAQPTLIATTGSFRGLGGLFVDPPVLLNTNTGVVTRSGNSSWLMTADAFGTTWHRCAPIHEKPPVSVPGVELVVKGTNTLLHHHSGSIDLGSCGTPTSAVLIDGTVAVTTHRSFAIRFIALPTSAL